MTTSNKNQQLTAVGLTLLATASAQSGIRPQTFAGDANDSAESGRYYV